MASMVIDGPVIWAGFVWRHTLAIVTDVATPVFPAGAVLRADVRVASHGKLLGTLTTANGGLRIIDASQIEIVIPGEFTKAAPPAVIFDIVRGDGAGEEPVGVQLTIPVLRTITAPHGAGP